MDERARLALTRLSECLDDASACINQVPDTQELQILRGQLHSLQLILDRNREALRLRILDHEQKGQEVGMTPFVRISESA